MYAEMVKNIKAVVNAHGLRHSPGGAPTTVRGRSDVLRAQPEVVNARGLRHAPGGAPTAARGRSGVLRAQPEVVNAHSLRN